jgi:asparagine synthase (glutamine-hydrolysing)
MSGIAGIIRFDGRPIEPGLINRMTDTMDFRGPDGIRHWTRGPVALGHCLLATTEEAAADRQPLSNEDQSCILVMDGWLQNWTELRANLLAKGAVLRTDADCELVLRAYELWGRDCLAHLHGDFAFVIWDARRHEAFCARDRIGMRPFYYFYSEGLGFVFASDPKAILTVPDVPRKLDEGRIADTFFPDMEGFDQTSTFYRDVYRLAPAHCLSVRPQGLRNERYWRFEPPNTLRLPSDNAYMEAIVAVLGEVVRCRLRGGATTAAMLSGGLDSSSIVAMAHPFVSESGGGPLKTFSAIGPDPSSCIETRTIYAAATLDGIDPRFVDYSMLDEFLPELSALSLAPPTLFDRYMVLIRSIYLAAHRAGAKVVLDGAGGDLVLNSGGLLAYLLRGGRWFSAIQEARAERIFYGGGPSAASLLLDASRAAFVPGWVRGVRRRFFKSRRYSQELISNTLINPDFARRIGLDERLAAVTAARPLDFDPGSPKQRARTVFDFRLVGARERYEREAARLCIEPRDPYLDVRMITFCLSLPVELTLRDGWPKFIMRAAMSGRLPDAVLWRRGRSHLGRSFTNAVMAPARKILAQSALEDSARLAPYIDIEALRCLIPPYLEAELLSPLQEGQVLDALLLSRWLAAEVSL